MPHNRAKALLETKKGLRQQNQAAGQAISCRTWSSVAQKAPRVTMVFLGNVISVFTITKFGDDRN